MTGIYFMHRIKHLKAGTWDKGIEVKDQKDDKGNFEAAKQSYHAYLGTYAYGNNNDTDYVACYITDFGGNRVMCEIWDGTVEPEPVGE